MIEKIERLPTRQELCESEIHTCERECSDVEEVDECISECLSDRC